MREWCYSHTTDQYPSTIIEQFCNEEIKQNIKEITPYSSSSGSKE